MILTIIMEAENDSDACLREHNQHFQRQSPPEICLLVQIPTDSLQSQKECLHVWITSNMNP